MKTFESFLIIFSVFCLIELKTQEEVEGGLLAKYFTVR